MKRKITEEPLVKVSLPSEHLKYTYSQIQNARLEVDRNHLSIIVFDKRHVISPSFNLVVTYPDLILGDHKETRERYKSFFTDVSLDAPTDNDPVKFCFYDIMPDGSPFKYGACNPRRQILGGMKINDDTQPNIPGGMHINDLVKIASRTEDECFRNGLFNFDCVATGYDNMNILSTDWTTTYPPIVKCVYTEPRSFDVVFYTRFKPRRRVVDISIAKTNVNDKNSCELFASHRPDLLDHCYPRINEAMGPIRMRMTLDQYISMTAEKPHTPGAEQS